MRLRLIAAPAAQGAAVDGDGFGTDRSSNDTRVCVRGCLRACVHAGVRACVHACMCVHACVHVQMTARAALGVLSTTSHGQ